MDQFTCLKSILEGVERCVWSDKSWWNGIIGIDAVGVDEIVLFCCAEVRYVP